MRKGLTLMLITMVLLFGLVVHTNPVVADGANKTEVLAASYNMCDAEGHPDCWTEPTEFIQLPDGKMMIRSWLSMMKFTTQEPGDPRWDAICHAYTKVIPPNNDGRLVLSTHFICQPNTIPNGYWEGTVISHFTPDGDYFNWTAIGYGDLKGQISIAKVDPSDNLNHITIIDTGK